MEPVLSRLKVKNFKSIGDPGIDLELKPLTILVGPNGSGKSSVLEALALLAANVEQEEFRLKGELTQSFDTPQQIAHKHELSRWITWEIHLPDNTGVRYEHKLDSAENREIIIKAGKDILQTSLLGDSRHGYRLVTALPGREEVVLGDTRGLFFTNTSTVMRDTKEVLPRNTLYPLWGKNYRFDLYDSDRQYALVKIVPKEELQALLASAAATVGKVANTLKERLFLLSDSRGEVPSKAGFTAADRFVGIRGESLIAILNVLQGSSEPDYQRTFRNIQFWAKEFGLLKLKPGLQPTGTLGVQYTDTALKTPIDVSFAGHGSRQIISIITQLFWAVPDSVIMIEEPEISLHPEAQVKLGELFAAAIAEDKQILATTHSDFLLLSLSRAVQKGLSVDDIAVYEITKGREGTKAKFVKLSKRGYPLGWPPSYAKVQRDVTLNWAASLPRE